MLSKFCCFILIIALFLTAQPASAQEYYPLSEESTFLTFPEWYIVFSAQEYAKFLKDGKRPSQFNYLDSVKTYWTTYYKVTKETIDRGYPFNFGNHLMLGVIGVSYSGEYLAKALYESTIGAWSEKAANFEPTFEDKYAEHVAEDYGQFLTHTPWYDFPFQEKLSGLWTETPALSKSPNRSIERKIALSIEYEFKALYGALMHYAAGGVYAPANPEITAKTSAISKDILEKQPDIRVIEGSDSADLLIALPRYNKFSKIMPELLKENVEFSEIAGHDLILITALGPQEIPNDFGAEVLFETPVYSEPNLKRVALVVQIAKLKNVYQKLQDKNFTLEHLFDY